MMVNYPHRGGNVILETLRIISTALQHVSYGVNVKLAALTLDGSDAVPADVLTFLEASSSDLLASGMLMPSGGSTSPVLGVVQMSPIIGPAAISGPVLKEYSGDFAVWYITTDTDVGAAMQDGLYTMRAVGQCLTSLMLNANAAARDRNASVAMQLIRDFEFLPVFTKIEQVQVTAALQFTVELRDAEPI